MSDNPASKEPRPTSADHPAVEEHRALKKLLDDLSQAKDREKLLECVESLERSLTAHFAAEEAAGGMFELIRERSPSLVSRVDELMSEHGKMLDCLAQIREELLGSEAEPSESSLRLVREFDAKCRTHEAAETDLLEDALYKDLGAKD